jgi:squalene-hopene/tetraprenyl-beta-curcumene cyclase
MDWWLHWQNAARDHETSCVSCHTALRYALARPALHGALEEKAPSTPERMMLANVIKRVQLWKEVEPFYPDQTRGLPKTSESRGTESVLNALVLATRDSYNGTLSEEARTAFNNMWALQFKAGDLKGAWVWLNFHYEPWESPDSPYFGATLAAVAIGRAPEKYSSTPEIQESLKLLREYLQQHADSERLFNRVMALCVSTKLSGVLTPSQTKAIIDDVIRKQRDDGGWAMSDLGTWKRVDSTELDTASDGYATGLITLALKSAGLAGSESHVVKAVGWLSRHQDPKTGMWSASSLNKQRDPSTDIGQIHE